MEQPAHDAAHEQHGDEYRHERDGHRENGEPNLASALERRYQLGLPHLHVPNDVLEHYNGVVYDEKAVQGLLKAALAHKLPQGTQLTSENTKLTYDVASSTKDGRITLSGHASGFYTPVFLQSAIRSHLKGMSPSSAHAFLQSLPNVVDARIIQSPYGLPWLPLFSSRISLKIQEVASPSSS